MAVAPNPIFVAAQQSLDSGDPIVPKPPPPLSTGTEKLAPSHWIAGYG